jgi:hypothetical protein
MIDRAEAICAGVAAQRFEIGVPVLAGAFQKIQQAAADAVDRGPASSTSTAMAQTPGPWVT